MDSGRLKVGATVGASVGCAMLLVFCSDFNEAATRSSPEASAGDTSTGTEQDSAVDGSVPVTGQMVPFVDAITVSAGGSHTCAINAAHDVFCWGSNADGQLGVPAAKTLRSAIPLKVPVGGPAVNVASGARHTCATLTDGTIKCWGANDRGQLGRGNFDPQTTIDVVSPPSENLGKWSAPELLSAGTDFTCMGGHDVPPPIPTRNIFCWGENTSGQLGSPKSNNNPTPLPTMITLGGDDSQNALPASTISAGTGFACVTFALAAGGGAVYITGIGCWGSRTHGEIGAPAMPGYELNPLRYPSSVTDGGSGALYGPQKPAQVAAGDGHGCAVLTLGGDSAASLSCWGNNTVGQTGSTTTGVRPAERVSGFDPSSFTALAAGGRNTCLLANHEVLCIGANDLGQLGRGSTTATATSQFASAMLPATATAISVGTNHACAVLGAAADQPGQVACWGNNANGELGDGSNLETGYSDAQKLKHARSIPVGVVAPKP